MSRDPKDPRSNPDPNPSQSARPDAAGERALDEAIDSLRADTPSEDETRQASRRAWERLSAAAAAPQASLCHELRAELPALREGRLSAARASLLAAHGRDCLGCRRVLLQSGEQAGQGPRSIETPAARAPRRAWLRPAAAAAALVGALGLGWLGLRSTRQAPGELATAPTARLVELDGQLFDPASAETFEPSPGDELAGGRWFRTGKASRARLELSDGSRVEINERSEFLVRENGTATTVRLARGELIVEAARRPQRDLFVETSEMSVAVKGTIFAVGHGLKGSRVGVIEGSVEVDAGQGRQPLLAPGQQMSSRGELRPGELREQLRWSRQVEQYRAMLDELESVQAALAKEPFEHLARHSTELLDVMPADTVFYAALPNSSNNLRRFVDLVTERLDQSPELRDWWQGQADDSGAPGRPSFQEMLDSLEQLSAALGDEVVLALALPAAEGAVKGGEDRELAPMPVLLSRLRDPEAFHALVEQRFAEPMRRHGSDFAGIKDRAALEAGRLASPDGEELHVSVLNGDTVVVGASAPMLLQVASNLEGLRSSFRDTSFYRTLRQEYRRGAETLIAVDLQTLVGRQAGLDVDGRAGSVLESAGLTALEHFVVRSDGAEPASALLSFSEDRRGLLGWLAEPAPMGSLEFVSPQATAVLSAVFADPAGMLADVQGFVGNADFNEALADFQEATGLDLIQDVAVPLGGELTIALDGPLFPTPAWKAIVEVYDPARLQLTFERLVEQANHWIRSEQGDDGPPALLELREVVTAEGRLHALRHPDLPVTLHYTFQDGYLVAASSRYLLESALRDRRMGDTILGSPRFTEVLPKEGEPHFSLIVWQDLGPALGLLLGALDQPGLPAGTEPRSESASAATLLHARASERAIELAVSSEGAGPGAHLAALLRRALAEGLEHAAERGIHSSGRQAPGYDAPARRGAPVPASSY